MDWPQWFEDHVPEGEAVTDHLNMEIFEALNALHPFLMPGEGLVAYLESLNLLQVPGATR